MTKRKPGNVTADQCLLTYLPSTYPSPLQVSTPQTPITGILHTSALNQDAKPIYCNKVLVAVPVGPDPEELFAISPAPTASCNTSKWTISSLEIKTGAELGLDTTVQYATFTFQCRAQSDFLINYNLVFGVQGQMTGIISNCTVMIQETSGTSSDPNTFTNKRTTFTVAASTPQFYLQNLVATAPASPTVPATEFANGADIQFAWESNGTFFQIYQKNVPQPIYAGTQTSFRLPGGVARDTTFFLVAMMSGNPSGDSPFGGYQPIYLYDALTVTISNPDLTPRNATVSGTLGVTGQTNLANAHVGGTLGVTGQTTLANTNVGALGVSGQTNLGNAAVSGTFGVTGQTNLANAIISGALTANGNSTLNAAQVNNSLTVSGATNLNGGLTAKNGPASILTGPQPINPGSYTARTDGLVIGVVSWPSGYNNLCVCWITGSTPGLWVVATGGNQGAFSSGWDKWQTSNGNSFVFPVSKGNQWSVGVQQFDKNQVAAPTAFYWVPLGTAPSGATFEWVSDEQPHFDSGAVNRRALSKETKVLALVDVIEEILKRPIETASKHKLLRALQDLETEEYTNEFFPGD